MPALKPKYASQSEIPEALREYYVQNGSIWELAQDGDEIAVHFNSGLASNRDALKTEKDALSTRLRAAEQQVTALQNEKQQLTTGQATAIADATRPLNDRINALQTELGTIKAPGSVVLPQEKAAALVEFEKLGTPKDVTEKLTVKLPALESEVAGFKKAEEFRTIAKQTGYDPDVLNDIMSLPRNAGLSIKMKKIKVKAEGEEGDGKMTDVAHIVTKGEGADAAEVFTPLTEYATSNWSSYLPALQAGGGSGGDAGGNNENGNNNGGVRVPEQRSSGGGGTAGKVDAKKILESSNARRNSATNPLAPAPPAKAATT
jgi:hypothetical protein